MMDFLSAAAEAFICLLAGAIVLAIVLAIVQAIAREFAPGPRKYPYVVVMRADRDRLLDITKALKSDAESDSTRWN